MARSTFSYSSFYLETWRCVTALYRYSEWSEKTLLIRKITQICLVQVQYEVNGVQYGSKSSAINMEAKPFNEIRVRSCVMTKSVN